MKIIMIGDSFGMPNYAGPPGAPPETHVEFLLKERKYDVENLSIAASNNTTHLHQLERWIARNPTTQIDYILWFHNSCSHNIIIPNVPFKTNEAIEKYLKESYKKAQLVKQKTTAKWFVIGGGGALPDYFFQYKIHDYAIPDWKSKILKEYLPNLLPPHQRGLDVQAGATSQKMTELLTHDLNTDDKSFRKTFNSVSGSIRLKVLRQKLLFPDGGHPGIDPHRDLFLELIDWFNANKFKESQQTLI